MRQLQKSQFMAALASPASKLSINGSGRVICEPEIWEVKQRRIRDHLIYYCECGHFNLWTASGEFMLRTNDIFLFSRQFKVYKGVSPTQWRNNH